MVSIGRFDMFWLGLVIPSTPSLSARPPQAPLIMSTNTNGLRAAP